ncbi:type II toxin-antitoxin system VapC family toxin [Candidatus Woesearchaeota archaeon]|nr:type II toxin-antitoxin system VapC family toxin [Candidatus Woesearchaeota archaeon]
MIGVDSNIIIDILRDAHAQERFPSLAKDDADICTSEIVVYEVLYGIYKAVPLPSRALARFNDILDTFSYIFPIDRAASVTAAKIGGALSQIGKTIEHRDALIAGSLLAKGCSHFLTRNTDDFKNIKGMHVVDS